MGVNATPMAYAEVFTALEIHAIDGLEHPPVDMLQNRIFEVQKYLAISHHVYTPVSLVVSKKWFATLTADQQAAIRKAAISARDFQRAEEIRQTKDAVSQLQAKGMTVTELGPQELEKCGRRSSQSSKNSHRVSAATMSSASTRKSKKPGSLNNPAPPARVFRASPRGMP